MHDAEETRRDIEVGEGEARRRIAVLARDGAAPAIVWFGGFRSEMRATKADALAAWAGEAGRASLRFDYSGHGASDGSFEDGTISRWLEDALAALERLGPGRPVFVGSSMGGWIALLAARRLAAGRPERAPASLVLIAPAVDFTEALMWEHFTDDIREAVMREGRFMRPSLYSDEPYGITRELIEDGRRHLMLDAAIETGCPVHILQGMRDPDVPWEHAMQLVDRLPGESVQLTLLKDGDHRLSRPEDLDLLVRSVEAACRRADPGPVRAKPGAVS